MSKNALSIIVTIGIAGLAAFLVIQRDTQLREEVRALREQMEQLAPLQAKNDHLSKLLAQAADAEKLALTQGTELLRLRSEVETLRSKTNELGNLLAENQRLRSSELPSQNQTMPTDGSVPRESWALVGYADPESAFESTVWAMSQGDAKTFRASLAPDAGDFAEWEQKSDEDLSARIRDEMEKVTAFKILDKEAVSDDTAILTVMAEGMKEVGSFRFQRVGDDWKLAGKMSESGAGEVR